MKSTRHSFNNVEILSSEIEAFLIELINLIVNCTALKIEKSKTSRKFEIKFFSKSIQLTMKSSINEFNEFFRLNKTFAKLNSSIETIDRFQLENFEIINNSEL